MADEKIPPLRSSIGNEAIGKDVGFRARITSTNAIEIKDADEAMRAFAGYEGTGEMMDEATNRRLLRKIDLRIMPVCGRRNGDGGKVKFARGKSKERNGGEQVEDRKKQGRRGEWAKMVESLLTNAISSCYVQSTD